MVGDLDDAKLFALSRHPSLETIFSDGNSRVTDRGVEAVARMGNLVDLDLEWSEAITDDALAHLASAPRLRWVEHESLHARHQELHSGLSIGRLTAASSLFCTGRDGTTPQQAAMPHCEPMHP